MSEPGYEPAVIFRHPVLGQELAHFMTAQWFRINEV